MQIQRDEYAEHGRHAEAVNLEEVRHLLVQNHRLDAAVRQPHELVSTHEAGGDHKRPQKFQRVDVQQHDKEQDTRQRLRHGVVEAVAAEVRVVARPDLKEQRETDRECDEATHRFP